MLVCQKKLKTVLNMEKNNCQSVSVWVIEWKGCIWCEWWNKNYRSDYIVYDKIPKVVTWNNLKLDLSCWLVQFD